MITDKAKYEAEQQAKFDAAGLTALCYSQEDIGDWGGWLFIAPNEDGVLTNWSLGSIKEFPDMAVEIGDLLKMLKLKLIPFEDETNIIVVCGLVGNNGGFCVMKYETLEKAADYLVNVTWMRDCYLGYKSFDEYGDNPVPHDICLKGVEELAQKRSMTDGECSHVYLTTMKDLIAVI